MIEIIHAGAAQMPVAGRETGWPDNGRVHAETGAHAQHGSGVLRNVGLEQGEGERSRREKRGHFSRLRSLRRMVSPAPAVVASIAARLPRD